MTVLFGCSLMIIMLWTESGAVPPITQPAATKSKAAIFSLAGDADEELREKVGFALRTKLGRQEHWDVIDGVTMKELGNGPVTIATPADVVRKLAADQSATVLIWGELRKGVGEGLTGSKLVLKVLDLGDKDAKPVEVTRAIDDPTDLRFVVEDILSTTIRGVKTPDRPNEQAVKDDAVSKALWETNPNLLANGDFSVAGGWEGIYVAEKYRLTIDGLMPEVDKIRIFRMPLGPDKMRTGGLHEPAPTNNVLAMNLSRDAAENNGLACLSDPIKIKPDRRYRVSFRYKSDGPSTHVFVKGYTAGKDINDAKAGREIFRTQVPPTGATGGKWETVVCDINPYHPAFAVQTLRVDLYAYAAPGVILWDDVIVKEIGPLVDRPKDDAIKPPTTRPNGAK